MEGEPDRRQGFPAKECAVQAVGFEYPAFLMKISVYRWIAGYLIIGAVLITLEIIVGHQQWTVWSYVTFGYIAAFLLTSAHGFWKGWLVVK
jgi:hypothetical protein